MCVRLIVSLDKYETLLLDNFQASFLNKVPELVSEPKRHVNFVLTNFHWTYQVQGTIEELLYDEDWVSRHRGDPQLIWTLLSQRLRSEQRKTALSCSSKHNLLFQDNPQLIEQMTNLGEGDIMWDLRPAQGQEPFWDIAVNLLLIDQLGIPGIYDSEALSAFLDLARNLILEGGFPSSAAREKDGLNSTPLHDRPALDTVQKYLERNFYDKELRQNDESKEKMLSAEDDDDHNHDDDYDDDDEIDERSGDADSALSNRNFEIWSLVRSCATLCRSTKESFEAVRAGLEDCGFYEENVRYGNQYISRKNDEKTNEDFKYLYAFSDPVKYLEFIPWKDLRQRHQDQSDHSLLWRSEKSVQHDHHFHSEEEVFKFCIENDFYFPGHLSEGVLVFEPRALKSSRLLTEMKQFWEAWNDCAITQDTTSGEWYLLETVPGMEFRKLYYEKSHKAALNYFRRIVDDFRFGRVSMLSSLLGTDRSWNEYHGVLEVIPFGELINVDPQGLAGGNGMVHRADWMCPQKIHMIGAERIPVALKSMQPGERAIGDFLSELNVVMSALLPTPVNCITFYGITKSPPDDSRQNKNLPPDTLFLVFEWASQGSLLAYLRGTLRGGPKDWDIILGFIEDVAVALEGVHEVGIVHRDIHRNNVLITSQSTPNDPYTREEIVLLLNDFGEGRASDAPRFLGRKYYGNTEFWAPEVKKSKHYSFKSDVYAVGYLMADMILARFQAVQACTGLADRSVPRVLLNLVVSCLAENEQQRPTAKDLRLRLEDFHQASMRQVASRDNDYELCFTDFDEVPIEGIDTSQRGMSLDRVKGREAGNAMDVDEDGIPF